MGFWETVRNWFGNQRLDSAVMHLPSGLGGPDDPLSQTVFPVPARIPQPEADAAYCHWVGRRVVDTLPDAMGREWGYLSVGGATPSTVPEQVEAELRRLGAQAAFVQAQKLANLYGGAGIVIVADDGQDPARPVDPQRLKTITELRVVDGWRLFPVLAPHTDPRRPEQYRLHSWDGTMTLHRSRVLRFDGLPVPPNVMTQLDGWSDSVLRPVLDPCRAYQLAIQSVAAAVRDYEILVHGISHLGTILKEPTAQNALMARARRNRQLMATFRTLFIDKEAESLEFVGRNFSGIAEAVELLRHNLQAASGLPPAIFEGQFPSGLGATGISERLQWADQVRAAQETQWRRPIEKLLRLVFAAETGPPRPDLWRWEWRSVFQLTDEEKVQLRNTQANADATYIREGVLLPEEVAQSRFGGSQYSFETVLNPQLREERRKGQDPFAALQLDSVAARPRAARRAATPGQLLLPDAGGAAADSGA